MKVLSVVLVLSAFLGLAFTAKFPCRFKGRLYKAGALVTPPGISKCLKFRCTSGRLDLEEAGCELNSHCYPVNKFSTIQCSRFLCVKALVGGRAVYRLYLAGKAECMDYRGICVSPGQYFSAKHKGTLYVDCVCQVTKTSIKTICKTNK